jgi:hypothetical protein
MAIRISSALAVFCVGSSALAAEAPDPAAVFVSKMFLGEFADAQSMISGDVELTENAAAIEGRRVVDAASFVEAVKGCDLRSVRNVAPVSDFDKIEPEFQFTWDCKGLGARAIAIGSEGSVRISQYGKIAFTPPPVPKPNSDGGK